MAGLGYAENREVSIISEGNRSIFENHHNKLHIDVFFDKLDFCHVISWDGRLEVASRPSHFRKCCWKKCRS